MKSLKTFFANKLDLLLVFTLVLVCLPLITRNFSPSAIFFAKTECNNIEGYKNWISTNKDTLTPKPYGTNGYLIESINPLGIDYAVYVVTCNERLDKEDEWPSKTQSLLVYSGNSKSFLDFSLMELYVNFLSIGDINKNGTDDVQIQMATGGNCSFCEWKEIFEVKDDKVAWLTKGVNHVDSSTLEQGNGQTVKNLEDLDADSILELVVLESGWVGAFDLCNACSPGVYKIYKWSGASYEEDKKSKAYLSFHREGLESSLAWWKDKSCDKSSPNGGTPDDCLAEAIEVLLEYDALGMRDEGWRFFLTGTNPEFIRKKYGEVSDSIIQARVVLKKQYDKHNGSLLEETYKLTAYQ